MKATQARPWLKYYKREDLALEMPHLSIVDYLLWRNEGRMDMPALNYFGRIFSLAQAYENSCKSANAYACLGVKKGDIVVCIAPTLPETVYTFYGLSLLGACANMIDPRYSAEGIRKYIEEVNCKYVFAVDAVYDKVVEAVQGTSVEKVIVISPAESLPAAMRFAYCLKNPMKKNMPSGFLSWSAFFEQGKSFKVDYLHGHYDSCCVIVHTGGTTGSSKSVMLSHNNINAVSFQYTKCKMKYTRVFGEDKFLNIMPPFVAYGLGYGVHLPLCSAICSVIIPKFEPADFAKYIKKYQPQDIAGAPSHFLVLMNDRRMKHADLSCFKNACAGGDAISLQNEALVNKFLLDRKCPYPLTKGYGMTELAAVSTACMLDINRPGSVGIPHADFLIAAFDPETGEELEIGESGEICIHGPTMMMGYYQNPAETDNIMRIHSDGLKWIHTGDLGHMDEDGFLYIEGRIKRVIIRPDGFKVFPHIIEDAICSLPDVFTATVVGVSSVNDVQGQLPYAFFTLASGCEKSPQAVINEIKTICKTKLAEYVQPQYFTCLDKLPLTPIGKVDFLQLEKRAQELLSNGQDSLTSDSQ